MQKIIHRIFFNFDNKEDPFLCYLDTWQKQLPDFEIKMWNQDNLPVDLNAYTSYMAKKRHYAFLSDYFRCWLLNRHGGVYFDTDIEVLDGSIFRDIYSEAQQTNDYSLFIGIESVKTAGLTSYAMGIKCGETHPLLAFLMNMYEKVFTTAMRHIVKKFPIPDVMSLYFMDLEEDTNYNVSNRGYFFDFKETMITDNIKIYSQDYFSPVTSYNNDMMISAFSKNTCLCHHFAATWKDSKSSGTGGLFSELLRNNYYVIPDSLLPEIRNRYKDINISPRKPSWSLNTKEITGLERMLNRVIPYDGLLYSFLRNLRKR